MSEIIFEKFLVCSHGGGGAYQLASLSESCRVSINLRASSSQFSMSERRGVFSWTPRGHTAFQSRGSSIMGWLTSAWEHQTVDKSTEVCWDSAGGGGAVMMTSVTDNQPSSRRCRGSPSRPG